MSKESHLASFTSQTRYTTTTDHLLFIIEGIEKFDINLRARDDPNQRIIQRILTRLTEEDEKFDDLRTISIQIGDQQWFLHFNYATVIRPVKIGGY